MVIAQTLQVDNLSSHAQIFFYMSLLMVCKRTGGSDGDFSNIRIVISASLGKVVYLIFVVWSSFVNCLCGY